jgi:cell division protease FtsH
MVCEYGLSPAVGPVGYGPEGPTYLDQPVPGPRGYAEATQRLMDREVTRLVREAEQTAAGLLLAHRGHLDALVSLLLEEETVDGDAVYALVGRPRPGREPDPAGPPPAHRPDRDERTDQAAAS